MGNDAGKCQRIGASPPADCWFRLEYADRFAGAGEGDRGGEPVWPGADDHRVDAAPTPPSPPGGGKIRTPASLRGRGEHAWAVRQTRPRCPTPPPPTPA